MQLDNNKGEGQVFVYSLFIQVNSFNTNVLVSQEALIKLLYILHWWHIT